MLYQAQLSISRKLKKSFFVNHFCLPELKTLKFLTQKETLVTQISAASPSPKFYLGKSYVKKNNSVYFPCKIEKFELENVGVDILGTGFCFQGSH